MQFCLNRLTIVYLDPASGAGGAGLICVSMVLARLLRLCRSPRGRPIHPQANLNYVDADVIATRKVKPQSIAASDG